MRRTRGRGVPRAGKALGFGDLVGGYLGFENRQQALDGTSCEVQTWTNTNNTVGELSPEELSVAGLLGRTGDT